MSVQTTSTSCCNGANSVRQMFQTTCSVLQKTIGKTISCSASILAAGYRGTSAALAACARGTVCAARYSAAGVGILATKAAAYTSIAMAQLRALASTMAANSGPAVALMKQYPIGSSIAGGLAFATAGWAAYHRFSVHTGR